MINERLETLREKLNTSEEELNKTSEKLSSKKREYEHTIEKIEKIKSLAYSLTYSSILFIILGGLVVLIYFYTPNIEIYSFIITLHLGFISILLGFLTIYYSKKNDIESLRFDNLNDLINFRNYQILKDNFDGDKEVLDELKIIKNEIKLINEKLNNI